MVRVVEARGARGAGVAGGRAVEVRVRVVGVVGARGAGVRVNTVSGSACSTYRVRVRVRVRIRIRVSR